MMHLKTNLSKQILLQAIGLMGVFLFSSQVLAQQSVGEALSQEELSRINNQPLAPAVSASDLTSAPEMRKPSFQHKEVTGTEVTEYKNPNGPTEVQVKTKYTTYEMSPPESVKPGAQSGESDLLSVPSVSIPF
jgi:hypothetical protein